MVGSTHWLRRQHPSPARSRQCVLVQDARSLAAWRGGAQHASVGTLQESHTSREPTTRHAAAHAGVAGTAVGDASAHGWRAAQAVQHERSVAQTTELRLLLVKASLAPS